MATSKRTMKTREMKRHEQALIDLRVGWLFDEKGNAIRKQVAYAKKQLQRENYNHARILAEIEAGAGKKKAVKIEAQAGKKEEVKNADARTYRKNGNNVA